MKTIKISGFLHKIPTDLKKAIFSNSGSKKTWEDISPLARNEWICWVTSAIQVQTKEKRLKRALEDLEKGKRRPCCWPGCPHRRPSAKKWF